MKKETLIWLRLQGDNDFLFHCIKLLWKKQTEDEQTTVATLHKNFVGFSKADGASLGTLAEQLEKGYEPTLVEAYSAQVKMLKYAKQLAGYLTEQELE